MRGNAQWAFLAIAGAALSGPFALGQSPAMNIVNSAAEALGGKDRILSIRTLKIEGYGQQAYQNGGGNPTGSPNAPQKWLNTNGVVRTIDLEHGRMRLEQRLMQDFVFAYARNMTGETRQNEVLDGDVAYNVSADGKAARAGAAAVRTRRIEMLNVPVVLVRAALDPTAKLSNPRTQGNLQVIDVKTAQGDDVIVAFDSATHFPEWVSWVGPDPNLGDVTYRTHFVGYQQESGVMMPTGFDTRMDWRNIPWNKLYVAKVSVDMPVDDMAAPAAVKAATPAAPQPNVQAVPVAKGVWFMKSSAGGNSTLFEFDDHTTLFECYGSEANTKAIIDRARATVPGKPLTGCIISHHHFDHSGGLRAAVAEGLTIISHRDNEQIFREMTSRPATRFPDALGKNMKPMKFQPVDDHLKLKDNSMEVDLYRVASNNHMPMGIMAYVPRDKIVAQGDLVDEGWDIVWWGDSYPATVKRWNLQVERDLPTHGNMHTYAEVLEQLRSQIKNAQDLCARVEKAGLTMRGCPLTNTF